MSKSLNLTVGTIRVSDELVFQHYDSYYHTMSLGVQRAGHIYPYLKKIVLEKIKLKKENINSLIKILGAGTSTPDFIESKNQLCNIIDNAKFFTAINDSAAKDLISKIEQIDEIGVLILTEHILNYVTQKNKSSDKRYSKTAKKPMLSFNEYFKIILDD